MQDIQIKDLLCEHKLNLPIKDALSHSMWFVKEIMDSKPIKNLLRIVKKGVHLAALNKHKNMQK